MYTTSGMATSNKQRKWLNNSMDQSPSQANSNLVSQETPHLLWNQKIH